MTPTNMIQSDSLRAGVRDVIGVTCDFCGSQIEEYLMPAADMVVADVLLLSRLAASLDESQDFLLCLEKAETYSLPVPDSIREVRSCLIRGLMINGLSQPSCVSNETYQRRLSEMATHFN